MFTTKRGGYPQVREPFPHGGIPPRGLPWQGIQDSRFGPPATPNPFPGIGYCPRRWSSFAMRRAMDTTHPRTSAQQMA